MVDGNGQLLNFSGCGNFILHIIFEFIFCSFSILCFSLVYNYMAITGNIFQRLQVIHWTVTTLLSWNSYLIASGTGTVSIISNYFSGNCSSWIYKSYFHNKWRVTEYHVDGFRFDLASVLCRGTDGSPLDAPPLIKVSLALSCWQEMKISDFINFSWFLRNCYCFSLFGDFLVSI